LFCAVLCCAVRLHVRYLYWISKHKNKIQRHVHLTIT
jgi:hypothetical protein